MLTQVPCQTGFFVIQMNIEALEPKEAGIFVQRRRKALGLTQEKVTEMAGIPFASYLSNLETGKVSVGQSEYFPALIRILNLSEDEVRRINPDLIVTVSPHPSDLEKIGARSYRPSLTIPVLGDVAAGMFPIEVLDGLDGLETISADELEFTPGTRFDRLFALRVRGESMISQDVMSIPPGSTLVVESGARPRDGELLVAWVKAGRFEGGVVKVYYQDDGDGQVLMSLNPKGPVFRFADCEEVRVQGVVRQVRLNPEKWIRGRG